MRTTIQGGGDRQTEKGKGEKTELDSKKEGENMVSKLKKEILRVQRSVFPYRSISLDHRGLFSFPSRLFFSFLLSLSHDQRNQRSAQPRV